MSRLGTHGRCETSKLFSIENMHEILKDSLLKEISIV